MEGLADTQAAMPLKICRQITAMRVDKDASGKGYLLAKRRRGKE